MLFRFKVKRLQVKWYICFNPFMLFRFKVKRLQVKWYLCFQSLNYAVLFLGEMIAGEMVHLLSVSELCCFVFG